MAMRRPFNSCAGSWATQSTPCTTLPSRPACSKAWGPPEVGAVVAPHSGWFDPTPRR
jgi:hypothetical protein